MITPRATAQSVLARRLRARQKAKLALEQTNSPQLLYALAIKHLTQVAIMAELRAIDSDWRIKKEIYKTMQEIEREQL